MLKLDRSLAAARSLASKAPARFRVGTNGWVKITFSDDEPAPKDVLTKWISESHELMSATTKRPEKKKKTAKT